MVLCYHMSQNWGKADGSMGSTIKPPGTLLPSEKSGRENKVINIAIACPGRNNCHYMQYLLVHANGMIFRQ